MHNKWLCTYNKIGTRLPRPYYLQCWLFKQEVETLCLTNY